MNLLRPEFIQVSPTETFPFADLDRSLHVLFADRAPDIRFPYPEALWAELPHSTGANYLDPSFYDDPDPPTLTTIAFDLTVFHERTEARLQHFIDSAIFLHGLENGIIVGNTEFTTFLNLRRRAEDLLIQSNRSQQRNREAIAIERRRHISIRRALVSAHLIRRATPEYIADEASQHLDREIGYRLERPTTWRRPSRQTLSDFNSGNLPITFTQDDRALGDFFHASPILAVEQTRTLLARQIEPACPFILTWHCLIARRPYFHREIADEPRNWSP